jgi:hypothetical protein
MLSSVGSDRADARLYGSEVSLEMVRFNYWQRCCRSDRLTKPYTAARFRPLNPTSLLASKHARICSRFILRWNQARAQAPLALDKTRI